MHDTPPAPAHSLALRSRRPRWGGARARAGLATSKPIRAVIPFTAGRHHRHRGAYRVRAVVAAASASRSSSRTTRGRHGGTIGAGAVARADPDGYTVLAHSSAHAATQAMWPNAPYDTVRATSSRSRRSAGSPNIAVVAPDKGIKTLHELVAAAKAEGRPDQLRQPGVGSSTHFTTERFRFSAGFDGVHVPFRGMPEILTEVMTGRVDFCFSTIASALPFIRDGKLLALRGVDPEAQLVAARRADLAGSSATPIPTTRSGTGCSLRRSACRSSTTCRRREKRPGRGRIFETSARGASIRCRSPRRSSMRRSRRRLPRASRW